MRVTLEISKYTKLWCWLQLLEQEQKLIITRTLASHTNLCLYSAFQLNSILEKTRATKSSFSHSSCYWASLMTTEQDHRWKLKDLLHSFYWASASKAYYSVSREFIEVNTYTDPKRVNHLSDQTFSIPQSAKTGTPVSQRYIYIDQHQNVINTQKAKLATKILKKHILTPQA